MSISKRKQLLQVWKCGFTSSFDSHVPRLRIKGFTVKTQKWDGVRKEEKMQQSLKLNASTPLKGIYFNVKPIISVVKATFTVTCNWCTLQDHKTSAEERALFFHSFPTWARSHPLPRAPSRPVQVNIQNRGLQSALGKRNSAILPHLFTATLQTIIVIIWTGNTVVGEYMKQETLKSLNRRDPWEFWMVFLGTISLHFWSGLSFSLDRHEGTSAFGKNVIHILNSTSCYQTADY